MAGAIEELRSLRHKADTNDFSEAELRPLHLAAAQEAFVEKRASIPVLDKRAKEAGIDTIRSLEDMVPLLFSHTNYKSYPANFLAQKRWKEILQWLSRISTPDYRDVEVEGVADIDDLLERLWAKKYYVCTSSGTGGKLSMMPKSQADMDFHKEFLWYHTPMDRKLEPKKQFHFFCFGPTKGTYTATYTNAFQVEGFARPDSTHILIEEPMRNVTIMRMAELRRRIADGEAMPDEIAAMEAEAAKQAQRLNERFDQMVETFLAVRHEAVFLSAMTAQAWDLMQRLRAKGIQSADMTPDSYFSGGGGRKHLKHLPDDFQDQLSAFFGKSGAGGYGMSEMTWMSLACRAGRYHMHPFAAMLILDEPGEKLLPRKGIVEGRFAFLDPTTEYRWGGLISGDKVKADFGPCPCGRKGATLLDPIQRYADMNTDGDKIQCAGTIDAYIRGGFGEGS